MLALDEKLKLEVEIRKAMREIRGSIDGRRSFSLRDKDLSSFAVRLTEKKLAILSSSLFDLLLEKLQNQTIENATVQESAQIKASLEELNLSEKIEAEFPFILPEKIRKSRTCFVIPATIASVAVLVWGGMESKKEKKSTPLLIASGVASLLVLIPLLLQSRKPENVDELLEDYLQDAEASLLTWLDDIEYYYEEEITNLLESLK